MSTHIVRRRFLHRGVMLQVGDKVELTPSEYGRLGWQGSVSKPLNKPKRSRKRRKKKAADGSDTN